MRQAHQWDRVYPQKPTDNWRRTASAVTVLAIILFATSRCGMADIGYKYSPGVLTRMNLATVVMAGALVGLNLTVNVGANNRSYVGPVSAILIVIIGLCLWVLLFTPIS